MTTATGNYTPGCILHQDGHRTLKNQAEIDSAYRVDDGHLTRSYAHQVYRYGGVGQEVLDNGESLFSGNAGTSFGSLVDRAVPVAVCGGRLEDYFVVPPDEVLSGGARRGKAYTEWRQANAERTEVTASEFWKINRILRNVASHPAAAEILAATEDMQAAFRHVDSAGHKRKALADGVTPDYLWDFKTTSAEWGQLWRSCVDYGYLWQAAWYADAAVACGWPEHELKFVFAQTSAPFAVRVYTLPPELVNQARQQISETLDQIALRRSLGVYRSAEDEEELVLEFPAFFKGGDR